MADGSRSASACLIRISTPFIMCIFIWCKRSRQTRFAQRSLSAGGHWFYELRTYCFRSWNEKTTFRIATKRGVELHSELMVLGVRFTASPYRGLLPDKNSPSLSLGISLKFGRSARPVFSGFISKAFKSQKHDCPRGLTTAVCPACQSTLYSDRQVLGFRV